MEEIVDYIVHKGFSIAATTELPVGKLQSRHGLR